MRPRASLMAVGWLALLGCGANVAVPAEPTEEELCDEADDAEWSGGDCGGAFDECGLVACENKNGDGCDCTAPGQCWDGEACVDEPQ